MLNSKKIIVLIAEIGISGEKFVQKANEYTNDNYILKRYNDVLFNITNDHITVSFADDDTNFDGVDLVYLRSKEDEPIRHALALYLESKNITVVNSETNKFQTMSKLEQYMKFALAGVPIPNTVFVGRPGYYKKALGLLETPFPFVAKSINGRNGKDNVLIHNEKEVMELSLPYPVFQPFIPNQFDYRVITIGTEIATAYKRIRHVGADNYKNNISQGGSREFVDLPNSLCDIATHAASALGREFSGVDILTNMETGDSVVLEANFNFGTPSFETTESERLYYKKINDYLTGLITEKS